jgi:hypothetical protein
MRIKFVRKVKGVVVAYECRLQGGGMVQRVMVMSWRNV